ncbi:hypothetical protein H0G86_005055 [Trichoderma simmonsii]|uniref:Uncharacterized protein n=1 Tax=Trichoderma simmonsii TaxID=1491479 RepID=A0A8G0PFZ7_9HYPO|nr:hypothetical protein H0G86_005055 [Trichoderma simmonsii]
MSNTSPPSSSSGPTQGLKSGKDTETFETKRHSDANAEEPSQSTAAGQDRPSASIGALKQPDEEWDVIAEEEAAESRNARIPRGPVVIGRVGEKGSGRIIYLRQFVNKENSE